MSQRWTVERAERYLRSRELFGMRFGLERMKRMTTALNAPQQRFRSIHVVGTNGKTSTTRMIAAILERHGVSTGAYLSPHLVSYTERLQVGERDLHASSFAAAVARAAGAAERVDRTLGDGDRVTQFELLTAAAFSAMADRRVDVAVIEAGLGGRYDATNVIDSSVVVLTSVGLEHTRWLGPTIREIAEEKLAVLHPGTTLVIGADLADEAFAMAHQMAAERGARLLEAPPEPPTVPLKALGAFQLRNFALASLAAKAYLETVGIELREEAVHEAAAATAIPGRMQVVSEDPLTVLDGAHNPAAVAGLTESLREVIGPRHLGLVLGVLDDKDAAGMLRLLLPLCTRAWFTAPPSRRALPPAALQSLARQQGFENAICEPRPRRALAAAQSWASELTSVRSRRRVRTRGVGGAVLAAGSIYLVGELITRADRSGAAPRPRRAVQRSTAR